MIKNSLLMICGGLIMCGCVASGSSSRIAPLSIDQRSQKDYMQWAEEIHVGMIEQDLIKKKGEPDVVLNVTEKESVYYYWETREHIPVFLEGDVVVRVGGGH